jgi:hypothetical protein
MLLRLYADESADDASGIFRVAGYLMTEDQWKSLDVQIGKALGSLTWFHMESQDHLRHPQIYGRLLRTVTPESVLCGISASVNKGEYHAIVSERRGKQPLKHWMGSCYTFLVQAAMALCGIWCREEQRPEEWIAYFFEAGHPSQGDANVSLELFSKKQYKKDANLIKYASHTFLAKEGPLSRALIPADILAWHLTKWRRGGNQCKGLQHLLHVPTKHRDFNADDIRASAAKSKYRMAHFDKHGRPRHS